ncbi:protein kinase domain-containing protein [Janthinobacterium fluminis]|uniref:Protein kinase n=1 Tax=Janthinobacterium fluminis TaxID=2987524 RepID=A0ABT5K5J8_9BURK|nr:protein kinase [Janthinobacterium fluminis]MDC8759930.1 protein kinase [Janthinobacterium fluminis]
MLTAGAIITLERGHYRLREQIAGSAYGLLWRASAAHGFGDVALKLVNEPQMALAMPRQRARWAASAANEIAFLQSLQPWDERHIVRLLDSGRHQGLPVLALELLDGDLGKHVAALHGAGRSVPLARLLDWIGQLNQALAKVHQYGWRYLDLKPANVLLDARHNTVKLADFGTNRAAAAGEAHTYTGTASWQAPEQFFPQAGGTAYATGIRSDYFALGALFYFVAAGGVPLRFCSACGQAYREHHTGGAAMLLRRGGGAMPATLEAAEEALFARRIALAGGDAGAALALLRALLAAAPAARPANALQISRMLAQVRAGPQVPA